MKMSTPGQVSSHDGWENGEDAQGATRKPTRINSVDRAARVLMLIASSPDTSWKARSLAKAMNTTVPTMYHLVNTLIDCGLLTIAENGSYRLGISVARLAVAYERQAVPPSDLLGPLRMVAERTGESAYLSAWRNGEMEVIAHVPGTLPVRVIDHLGTGFRGVAHARAAGKVLLTFGTEEQREQYLGVTKLEPLTAHTVTRIDVLRKELRATRANGFGVEYEEFCDGVGCLSVPIISAGMLLGAYTVSAPIDRLRARQDDYLVVLDEAAQTAGRAGEILG
jgi:IclR family transcriptional regulator, acetate operon repressor